ncbi:hypothetical protein QTP88_022139 [Uroleucon formosanum]
MAIRKNMAFYLIFIGALVINVMSVEYNGKRLVLAIDKLTNNCMYNPLLTYSLRFKKIEVQPNVTIDNLTIDRFKEGDFVNGKITINSKELIDKVVGVFYRCDLDGINCEYFQTWTLTGICNKLKEKNQIWSRWYDSFDPPMVCPVDKKTYRLRNATLDVGAAILLYPQVTDYQWKLVQKLYSDDIFVGSYRMDICSSHTISIYYCITNKYFHLTNYSGHPLLNYKKFPAEILSTNDSPPIESDPKFNVGDKFVNTPGSKTRDLKNKMIDGSIRHDCTLFINPAWHDRVHYFSSDASNQRIHEVENIWMTKILPGLDQIKATFFNFRFCHNFLISCMYRNFKVRKYSVWSGSINLSYNKFFSTKFKSKKSHERPKIKLLIALKSFFRNVDLLLFKIVISDSTKIAPTPQKKSFRIKCLNVMLKKFNSIYIGLIKISKKNNFKILICITFPNIIAIIIVISTFYPSQFHYNPMLTYTVRFKKMVVHGNLSMDDYKIDRYKEGEFINGKIKINSKERINKAVAVFYRCDPDGINCEYFQTWTFTNLCKVLNEKNQIWSRWYSSFDPSLVCPLNKVNYKINNGTFDMGSALLLYPQATDYQWKLNQMFYSENIFVGSYMIEFYYFGYRKKIKSIFKDMNQIWSRWYSSFDPPMVCPIDKFNPMLTYTLRFKKAFVQPNIYGNLTIDQYRGTQFINGNLTVPTEFSIDKVIGIFYRCDSDGINCEYFQTWTFTDLCLKLKEKNQVWSRWYDSFDPPLVCPIDKIHYKINNGTFDIGLAVLLYPQVTDYEWRIVQKFYEGKTQLSISSIIINKQQFKSTRFSKYDSKICRPSYPLSYWVPFSVVLFDKRIKYVPSIFINDLEKDLPLLISFVTYLWTYRPKINRLFMNLVYVYKNCSRWNICMNSIQWSRNILYKCFEEGLASNQVQLQLTYQCNDLILIAIGRNSKCLKMLNVSCSSTITIDGIKSFLFKDLNTFQNDMLNGSEIQVYTFLKCIIENQEILNTVCFTLEEIRLQYTKPNNIGWIFILSCKIIMTVWNEIMKPKKFNLESITLSDWDINCDKIYTINEFLPLLKNLNTTLTRKNTIEYFQIFCRNGYIQNLSELTIKSVVNKYTGKARNLIILHTEELFHCFKMRKIKFDSNIIFLNMKFYFFICPSLDLALLQSGCPNLIVLNIDSVSLHINLKPTGKFQYLKTVNMKAPSEEIKTWFLFHGCPSLEELKIFNEMDPEYWKKIFITPPPIICHQMKRLEIVFVLPNGKPTFLIQPYIMNYLIITEFIRKCSVLNTFGSILNFGIRSQDVENIHHFKQLVGQKNDSYYNKRYRKQSLRFKIDTETHRAKDSCTLYVCMFICALLCGFIHIIQCYSFINIVRVDADNRRPPHI